VKDETTNNDKICLWHSALQKHTQKIYSTLAIEVSKTHASQGGSRYHEFSLPNDFPECLNV